MDLKPNEWEVVERINIDWGRQASLNRITTFQQHTNRCTYIVFDNLKFTLKHLKRSYMFRSYDHPQGP